MNSYFFFHMYYDGRMLLKISGRASNRKQASEGSVVAVSLWQLMTKCFFFCSSYFLLTYFCHIRIMDSGLGRIFVCVVSNMRGNFCVHVGVCLLRHWQGGEGDSLLPNLMGFFFPMQQIKLQSCNGYHSQISPWIVSAPHRRTMDAGG